MATQTITVFPFNPVVATNLLAGSTNLVVTLFGGAQSGVLDDDDGTLSDADDGASTFDGVPIDYIGSGLATPGIELLGALVATGPSVDVVVFEAGGQIYFVYPDGPPNLLGAVLLNVVITAAPGEVFTPICFAQGTLVATPGGDLPVETLGPGDRVTDMDGRAHDVLWVGSRTLDLPASVRFDPWRPIRIAANAFADGVPYLPTFVSRQHRILVRHPALGLHFHEDEALVPAIALVTGAEAVAARNLARIRYHHILCAAHVVLVANGMPAESLNPGPTALGGMTDAGREEVLQLFPDLVTQSAHPAMPFARPVLEGWQGRLLARAMWPGADRDGARVSHAGSERRSALRT